MALLHATASLKPGKLDVIKAWLPQQPWASSASSASTDDLVEVGSYRFDDPAGAVGLEAILVRSGPTLFQVPLTYRAEPFEGATAPIATMQHSALGTRYVYDGAADPAFLTMLAAVTLSGVGQAASVLLRDGRTLVRSPSVRLASSGGDGSVVPVDGFGPTVEQDGWALVASPDIILRVARRVASGRADGPERGAVLTGRGPALDGSVVLCLAEVASG